MLQKTSLSVRGSGAGSLYIIIAIVLWSSLGVIVKLSGIAVHVLMFYSSLTASMLLGLMLTKKQYRGSLPKGKIPYLFILAPLSLVNTFTFFYAFKNTTIANAILTHYIAPVVVAFLAPVFLGERITKTVVFSIIISSVGLWILLDMSPLAMLTLFENPSRDTIGIMSGLFSGFAYALVVIVIRVYAQVFSPVMLCFFQNLIISLLLLPFVRSFPINAIPSILIMGIVHSTIAPIFYVKGMSEVAASRAAVLGYIEPVAGIIFGMIFLNEYPMPVSILGGALILFSGYILLREKR